LITEGILDRNKFIEDNLGLAVSRVLVLNHGVYDEDMVQVASMALCIVADRYDPSKGFKFATYAVPYIDGYIKSYKNHNSIVRPIRKKDRYFLPLIVSFETPVNHDGKELLTLGSLLEAGIELEREVINDAYVEEFTDTLQEDERKILKLRIAGHMEKEIAGITNRSQAQISRKLKRIGKKYLDYKSMRNNG